MVPNSQFSVAECVSPGHPDKVCDQIADAIVDACLDADPKSRCAIEVLGKGTHLTLAGEVTSKADLTTARLSSIANGIYHDIGYPETLEVANQIDRQSLEIAQGVDTGGAGDQGVMAGFYTTLTPSGLPPAMDAARAMINLLEVLRLSDELPWLGPDCKSQVCIVGGKVTDVVLAAMHAESVSTEEVRQVLRERVVNPAIALARYDLANARVTINGTGRFTVGGFAADAGVVGRKIVVDAYGGDVPVGGGAFSGKDPTKVDRSAAYFARYVARAVVQTEGCQSALVRVAYAIGVDQPCVVLVWTERSGTMPHQPLSQWAATQFDWRPRAIIERLDLDRPAPAWSYYEAARGPFGRADIVFPWERSPLPD